jgi:2-iminobutanoate/2-iminopropanoate deaminase
MVKSVNTDKAPAPVGPYSHARVHGGTVYTAGQIALDPATGNMVNETFRDEVLRVCENLKAVLEAAGSRLDQALKVNVYLTDLTLFGEFNSVYGEYFGTSKPARSAVEVKSLPKGARIEMDVVAAIKD